MGSTEQPHTGRHDYALPAVVFPPGMTKSMILEAEQQILKVIMDCKGYWPTRPSVRATVDKLMDLHVGDDKTGQWRVVQDVLSGPSVCPSCQKAPKFGFYVLEEVQDKTELRMCGDCLRLLMPKSDRGLVRRYWRKVGKPLRAVSDWWNLMVAALIWLELHNDYENRPGTAREMWLAARWLYRRYMRFGYLRDYHADALYAIITDGKRAGVNREQSEIDTFRQRPKWTPEQNHLSALLSPELFPHLTVSDKERTFRVFERTGGDGERLGEPRTRTYLAGAHARALRRKNWKTGHG